MTVKTLTSERITMAVRKTQNFFRISNINYVSFVRNVFLNTTFSLCHSSTSLSTPFDHNLQPKHIHLPFSSAQ